MRVTVDTQTCDHHGQCMIACPEVFNLVAPDTARVRRRAGREPARLRRGGRGGLPDALDHDRGLTEAGGAGAGSGRADPRIAVCRTGRRRPSVARCLDHAISSSPWRSPPRLAACRPRRSRRARSCRRQASTWAPSPTSRAGSPPSSPTSAARSPSTAATCRGRSRAGRTGSRPTSPPAASPSWPGRPRRPRRPPPSPRASQDGIIKRAARAMRDTGTDIMLVPWYEFDQPRGHHALHRRPQARRRRVAAHGRPVPGRRRHERALRVDADGLRLRRARERGRPLVLSRQRLRALDRRRRLQLPRRAVPHPGRAAEPRGGVCDPASQAVHRRRDREPGLRPCDAGLDQAYGAWAALHPAVKAVNFFDSISPKGNDFRLIAHPALLAAFTTLGQESDMQAMP